MISPTSLEDNGSGLLYSVELLNAFGITAMQDASVNADTLDVYRSAEQRGQLSMRVVASVHWNRDSDMSQLIDINAAFINRLEQVSGSIEVGKCADSIVLSQNLFEIVPQAISETQVLLTRFAGEPVHGSLGDL